MILARALRRLLECRVMYFRVSSGKEDYAILWKVGGQ